MGPLTLSGLIKSLSSPRSWFFTAISRKAASAKNPERYLVKRRILHELPLTNFVKVRKVVNELSGAGGWVVRVPVGEQNGGHV